MFSLSVLPLLLLSGLVSSAAPPDWDYLILSLRWNPTLCSFTECTRMPRPIDFSVHGLWPTVYPDEMPTKCKSGIPFDEAKLMPLKPDLLQYWPNLRPDSKLSDLWHHEWKKHGQCATEDEVISNEVDYFRLSLQLRSKSNLLNMLREHEITPNNETVLQRETLLDVFHSFLNVDVALYCLKHHHQTPRLVEVRLCFTPTLDLRDCLQPCPSSQDGTTCRALNLEPALAELEISGTFSYSAMPCPPGDILFPDAGED